MGDGKGRERWVEEGIQRDGGERNRRGGGRRDSVGLGKGERRGKDQTRREKVKKGR